MCPECGSDEVYFVEDQPYYYDVSFEIEDGKIVDEDIDWESGEPGEFRENGTLECIICGWRAA